MLPNGPPIDNSSAEKGVACARCAVSAVGGARIVHGVNSVEESEDTHCGPKLQKCAHVLLYAGNVRNAARVRIRLANWVVRAAMRV